MKLYHLFLVLKPLSSENKTHIVLHNFLATSARVFVYKTPFLAD